MTQSSETGFIVPAATEFVAKLKLSLAADNYELVSLNVDGELIVDDMRDPTYAYRREVYQQRQEGEGINVEEWGGLRWEFCSTIEQRVPNADA